MATIIATSGSTIDSSLAEVSGTLSSGAAKRADLRPGASWPVLLIPAFGLILIAALWTTRLHQVDVEQQRTLETAMRDSESVVAAFEQYALRAIRDADRTTLLIKYALERDGAVNLPVMIQKGLIPTDGLIQVSVTDASGNVTASSLDARGARNMADREYFRLHVAKDTGTLDIGKPVLGRISGMMSIPFTRRVNRADGSFAGIVILQADPNYFTDFYKEADLGKHGVLSVVGTDGVFRARRAGYEPASTPDHVAPLLPKMLANPTGSLETESRIDHTVRLLSYRRLTNFPLVVTAAQAKSEVLAEFEERRAVHLGLATVASAIILVFFAVVTLLVVRLQRSQRRTWEARQILRAASDSSLDAFFLMRGVRDEARKIVDFVIRDLNARGAQLVGEARRSLIGRHMRGLSAFVKSGESVDKYTRVVETGEPLDEEFELDTPKAGRRWFRQQAVRVHDGLAITMRDITERKHNEQAVHAQRSFLQTLIDNIPVAVQVRSMKAAERGRIVLWNESYSVLFGIPVGQAIGKTVADVLSAASAERIEELDRQLLASPMVQEANDLTIVANGARRIVHVIRAPIFDAHNEVEYIISIVRDITDEQARANEIRLASKVFETTADAIVITDAEDFTVMVNSAFSKLTGFTPEAMLGRLLSETPFRPTDPVESAARMEHLHREGYVTGEVQRVHKDGSELVLWVTATCSRDAGGKIINYVRVFTDISPLKEAQRSWNRWRATIR
jgi:PAS domain S-box-containing protein